MTTRVLQKRISEAAVPLAIVTLAGVLGMLFINLV